MPTLTDVCGFEFGSASISGGGLLSINQGAGPSFPAGRRGGLCAQCAAASGGNSTVGRNFSGPRLVMRFYFRVTVAPTLDRTIFHTGGIVGGRPEILYRASDGHLIFGFVGGTYQDLGAISIGVWYRVDIDADIAPNPRTLDCQLNGVAGTQATLAVAGSTFVRWELGATDATASAMTTQFDDVAISTTPADYPLGPGRVIGVLPGSDGTHSFAAGNFKYGDAGADVATGAADAWTMLDEDPPWTTVRSTTDSLAQVVANASGYVEIAPSPTPTDETANGVVSYLAYSGSGTAANEGKCEVRNSDGTAVEVWGAFPSTVRDYSESTNFFKRAIVATPGAGWTPAEVDAIRWRCGGSGVVSPIPTWQALMLEVDYPTPDSTAPTPTWLCGFEHSIITVSSAPSFTLFGLVQLTAIAPAIDTTIKRGLGAKAVRLDVPTITSQGYFQTQTFSPNQTLVAFRFYFRKSGNPSQANFYIAEVVCGGGVFFDLTLQTDGTLQLRTTGGTGPAHGSASAVLNDDQWYCVDVVLDTSTTAYAGRLWVDDVPSSTDATTTAAAVGAIANIRFGKVQSGANTSALSIWFDDAIVGVPSSIANRFGPTEGIVGLSPNADATHNPTTPVAGRFKDASSADISAGNPAWDNLDDRDLNQTAKRVAQPVAAGTEYLEVAFETVVCNGGAPLGERVMPVVALNSDGTDAFAAATRVEVDTVEVPTFNALDFSTGPNSKWFQIHRGPVAGLPTVPSQSSLDGIRMRIGYASAQPAVPYWEGLMIEVDVGPQEVAAPTEFARTIKVLLAIELPDLRTQDAKHYRDGGLAVVEFGKVRHYVQDGRWADLDLRLIPLGGNAYRVSGHDIYLEADAGGLSVYKQPSGRGIRFLFPRPPDRVDGRSAYWTTEAGVEWRFTLGRLGLKTEATIPARRGPRTYNFEGQMLGGLAPPDPDADGNLVQPAGHFVIPRSYALGANRVRYECSAWRRAGGTVSFDFDDSALPDEALPYVIDPTTTFSPATADDGTTWSSNSVYANIPESGSGGAGTGDASQVFAEKDFDGGTYWVGSGIITWDTSAIPDDAAIVSAQLQVYIESRTSTDGRSLLLDWYSGRPIDGADFLKTGSGNAGCVPLSSVPSGGLLTVDLVGFAANVNKTGYSGIQGTISGGQPAGVNECWYSTFDHATNPEPKLVVVYDVQALRPDADTDAGGWTTTPLWSKVDEADPGGDVISAASS